MTDEELDEAVHEAKAAEAAEINNAGRVVQLAYLGIKEESPKVFWIITEGNDPEECADGEFGVEINGVPYVYYKWPDAVPAMSMKYRRINKREFGEVIHRPKKES